MTNRLTSGARNSASMIGNMRANLGKEVATGQAGTRCHRPGSALARIGNSLPEKPAESGTRTIPRNARSKQPIKPRDSGPFHSQIEVDTNSTDDSAWNMPVVGFDCRCKAQFPGPPGPRRARLGCPILSGPSFSAWRLPAWPALRCPVLEYPELGSLCMRDMLRNATFAGFFESWGSWVFDASC